MNNNEPPYGFVYILTNPSFPDGWIKVGKTKGPIEKRLHELHSTGVPLPFELYGFIQTHKYGEVESLMHGLLTSLTETRINPHREFYNFPAEDAYKLLVSISKLLDDGILSLATKVAVNEEQGAKHESLRSFWGGFISYSRERGGVFADATPYNASWISVRFTPLPAVYLSAERRQYGVRMQIYLCNRDAEVNKSIYDYLYQFRNIIEGTIGHTLVWQRLPEKVASRISYDSDYTDDEGAYAFFLNAGNRMYDIFAKYLLDYRR